MNLNNITKFIYLGIAAWAYSIIVQTPFAYFIWHFTFDQWVTWVFSGLLITTMFFGAPLRIFLNWCNSHFDRVVDSHKTQYLVCPNCGFTTKSIFEYTEHVDMDTTGNCEYIHQ